MKKQIFLGLVLIGTFLVQFIVAIDDGNAFIQVGGEVIEIPAREEFRFFRDMSESFGEEYDSSQPVPYEESPYSSNVNADGFRAILDFYKYGSLPQEYYSDHYDDGYWVVDKDRLKSLIKALDFLDADSLMEKIYKAWLNHDYNRFERVYHNVSGRQIIDQMGIEFDENEIGKRLQEEVSIPLFENGIVGGDREHYSISFRDKVMQAGIYGQPTSLDFHFHRDFGLGSFEGLQDVNFTKEYKISDIKKLSLSGVTSNEGNLTPPLVLKPNIFRGVPKLESIELCQLGITKINKKAFKGLDQLQTLDLKGNKLSQIDSGTFKGLDQLQTLDLYDNKLSQIDSGTFEGLGQLQTVNLSHNNITRIDRGAFEGLGQLQTLDLYDNKLSQIDSGTFKGLDQLQTVNLSHNNITRIERGAFEGLGQLQTLDLSRNNITRIERGAFEGLTSLKTIDLSGNYDLLKPNIEAIEKLDVFQRVYRGLLIMLYGNEKKERIRRQVIEETGRDNIDIIFPIEIDYGI